MPSPAGLYLHIPFCRQKCGYCDFYSLPASEEIREEYVRVLCRMLCSCPYGHMTFSTVYFGGGTPSLLTPKQIAALMEAIAASHTLLGDEVTLECNPGSVNADFFKDIRSAGINRISLGLQSADPRQLQLLGRAHTPEDVRIAVENARQAGLSNISLDVMLALPGQTFEELEKTLRFCVGEGVPHLSAYLLKIEPGTPFDHMQIASRCSDEDQQADLYLSMVSFLQGLGYRQYEISNFAYPGFESLHNLGYWRLKPYLGLGPGAHSFLLGERFFFPRDLKQFLHSSHPWELRCPDGKGGTFQEAVMLGLRLAEGIDLHHFAREEISPLLVRAKPMVNAGLMRLEGERLFLTPRGFLLSNSIIAQLLEEE